MKPLPWKLSVTVILAAIAAVCAWHFTICDGTSIASIKARKLSQDRLKLLHQQMADLCAAQADSPTDIPLGVSEKYPIPSQFSDINSVMIRPFGKAPIIRLKGCMDHHIDLVFPDLGDPATVIHPSPRIILRYGETEADQGEEVLWKK